jgi:hypothetical protein
MTYFSASSGGRTVSAAEAIGTPIPYLVSVSDPYDTLSPFHDWGPVLVSTAAAGKALQLGGSVVSLQTVAGPSGHIESVVASTGESQATLSGARVEADLGLRSSWFRFGLLALAGPVGAAQFGTPVTLTGSARGVGAVSLEGKTPTSGWQPVSPIAPDSTGAFSVKVDPEANTKYRLAAGSVRASLVRVPVVPVVVASLHDDAVAGTLKPALAGGSVSLQLQQGGTWTTVGAATQDADGSFAFTTSLTPGTYRVRWAPGQGLSPGVSQPLTVST